MIRGLAVSPQRKFGNLNALVHSAALLTHLAQHSL
jgi:hypothetical protein